VYAGSQQWPPDEFRANLHGFSVLNDLLVVCGHLASHNLTGAVLGRYLIALPTVLLGVVVGARMDRHLSADLFRRIVLICLFGVGTWFLCRWTVL
jgi:uncharacterized membrane protein YfcA